jgi:hypothetical protein
MWLVPNGGCRVLLFLAIYGDLVIYVVYMVIWCQIMDVFFCQICFVFWNLVVLNLLTHLLGWNVYEFCLKCVWVGCNVFIWAKTSAQFEAQFKFGLVKNCSCLRHHLPRQCHTVPHVYHVSATRLPCGCHLICHVAATSSTDMSSIATSAPRQQPTHLHKWRGESIHDDHFRHRFWASGWVQWALHQSMTTWERHGSR